MLIEILGQSADVSKIDNPALYAIFSSESNAEGRRNIWGDYGDWSNWSYSDWSNCYTPLVGDVQ